MLDIVDSITNILDVKNGSVFFMVFHNVFNISKIRKRDRLVYIIYLLIKLVFLILNNIVIFCV